jgi:hypothetical protein
MVILKGYVRDGKSSTSSHEVMVSGAVISQGARATNVSSDGTFYTSADVTNNYAMCNASEYKEVNYSIPIYATIYDPEGVIAGSFTGNSDITTSGYTTVIDTSKFFLSGALIGRVLSIRSGIYDGYSSTIVGNTYNTIRVGGGIGTGGWEW